MALAMLAQKGAKIDIWVIQIIEKVPDRLKRNVVALCMF
jgi:hypothetical protein